MQYFLLMKFQNLIPSDILSEKLHISLCNSYFFVNIINKNDGANILTN